MTITLERASEFSYTFGNEPQRFDSFTRYVTYQNGGCYYLVDLPERPTDHIRVHWIHNVEYLSEQGETKVSAIPINIPELQNLTGPVEPMLGQHKETLLIPLKITKRYCEYLYIHQFIVVFRTGYPLQEYHDHLGNSQVYYPYAYDSEWIYLLLERQKIPNNPTNLADPYEVFYDNTRNRRRMLVAQGHPVPPVQPGYVARPMRQLVKHIGAVNQVFHIPTVSSTTNVHPEQNLEV